MVALLPLTAAAAAASLVTVEQFGMSQCPMTTSWTTEFFDRCFEHGTGIKGAVNFTLNMVAGLEGGPVNSTTAAESFHGPQEVVADKYQLCARAIEPKFGLDSYGWVNFTACMNGADGIAIVALSTTGEVTLQARKCALEHGIDWQKLAACATGAQGAALFNSSAWYTSGEMAAKRIPTYGVFGINNATGFGIPIIRINGKVHKGLAAYELVDLGRIICEAAAVADCGCAPKSNSGAHSARSAAPRRAPSVCGHDGASCNPVGGGVACCPGLDCLPMSCSCGTGTNSEQVGTGEIG
jgi:hypothetical protein